MAARTHFTEHFIIEPDGRKWDIWARMGHRLHPEKGAFVAGSFTRLCDAMDAAEKAEQERATRVCAATQKPFRCPACREKTFVRAPQWVAGMTRYENIFACKRCGFRAYIPLATAEQAQEAK
jgi:hypothetical protein